MSREQRRGLNPVDRFDVYALGITLWEIFSWSNSFNSRARINPRNLNFRGFPRGIKQVIQRAVGVDKGQPFNTVAEIQAALQDTVTRPAGKPFGGNTARDLGTVAAVVTVFRGALGATWPETAEAIAALLAVGLGIGALVWIGRRLSGIQLFARRKKLQATEVVVEGAVKALRSASHAVNPHDHVPTAIDSLLPPADQPAIAQVRRNLETAADYIHEAA
jgi:hypothetical protein